MDYENRSPVCPWCGDEVSDSPDEDFVDAVVETECGGCGEPVRVVTAACVVRRADRIEE